MTRLRFAASPAVFPVDSSLALHPGSCPPRLVALHHITAECASEKIGGGEETTP